MRCKKATRVTILFKCTDYIELNLIESTCTFSISFDCAMILLSFNIVFILSSMMLQNICLNNSKEISNNLRRRLLIKVFNIYLIISIEFDCFLMICTSFLSLFEISTPSIKLNFISFIFLYLTVRESELMSTRIFFIATFASKTLLNFDFLLKTILFVRFITFEKFSLRIFFIADQMTFFYFRVFKIRTNYFNEDFHQILQTEKLFFCRAAQISINIFSSENFFLLCLFFEKHSFFTMMIELTFIVTDYKSLTYYKH